MKYFYSKETESKLLGTSLYTDKDIEEYFNGNQFEGYPNLNNENAVVTEFKMMHPTWTGKELREMTREELCATGDMSVLGEGEIYSDGKIKAVPNPSDEYLRYVWVNNKWVLQTTKEELILRRKDLILQYKRTKTEIEELEEFADEFESDEAVALLNKQLKDLKKRINELLGVIKKLGE